MSLSASFVASQAMADISKLHLVDNSTGSDNTITSRLVYIQKADGSYLKPTGTTTNYIIWSYSDTSIDIDVLDRDYSLQITVKWISGTTISYTVIQVWNATGYSDTFLLARTMNQTSNQQLLNSANYWYNKMKLRTLVDDATQAVAFNNDQTSAQACLDEAMNIVDNIKLFY